MTGWVERSARVDDNWAGCQWGFERWRGEDKRKGPTRFMLSSKREYSSRTDCSRGVRRGGLVDGFRVGFEVVEVDIVVVGGRVWRVGLGGVEESGSRGDS
jgi:hypothetical protein